MTIPPVHSGRYLYHFTHIDNLPNLLQLGLLANSHPNFPTNGHRSIAAQGIQQRRADMVVTCGPGGTVHDYVPLYFGSLSLMLLGVMHKKNIDQMDVVYFEFPISLVARDDVVFTSASANTREPPEFYSSPVDLENLNWGEIDSRRWSSDTDDLRHQRMAEVLVHSQLPIQEAHRIVVWNKNTRLKLQEMATAAGVVLPPITFEAWDRPHYFTNFMEGKKNESRIQGPKGIASEYLTACEYISSQTEENEEAPFMTPVRLLEALRADLGCIPHTAELVGLDSGNCVHRSTVGDHTLEVVRRLRENPEFQDLNQRAQNYVELAAYLHDIGKGPKSRWDDNDGVQKTDPDHPIRGMVMLTEILTDYVQRVRQNNVELLLKLICYHDLVGDVLGKGRDEQQIVDVVSSEEELRMLFILGNADASSLREDWWDEDMAEQLFDRCLLAISTRG